jgi:hypothetical protein
MHPQWPLYVRALLDYPQCQSQGPADLARICDTRLAAYHEHSDGSSSSFFEEKPERGSDRIPVLLVVLDAGEQ